MDELVAKGSTVTEPVTDVGDGIIVATVRDPFGQLIGLIRNPHFKGGSWTRRPSWPVQSRIWC